MALLTARGHDIQVAVAIHVAQPDRVVGKAEEVGCAEVAGSVIDVDRTTLLLVPHANIQIAVAVHVAQRQAVAAVYHRIAEILRGAKGAGAVVSIDLQPVIEVSSYDI